ncbi:MAG: DNA replication/repair protein RecF [Pedosphaera sp.]|nr:DNA replication/repair protein RecF [Pedosphaera sp.]
MHVARLKLRDFRNYRKLDVEFASGFHLILGSNAQGKTNLLEAIYALATLRSFRGVGSAQLIHHGRAGFFIGARIVGTATSEVHYYGTAAGRQLSLNQQPVRRLADYFGTVRAVVFCTEDLQLVKGLGRGRRRFMDLILSQTVPDYLATLQRYVLALRSRNALLKQRTQDTALLASFTRELVDTGTRIMQARAQLLPDLNKRVAAAYGQLAPGSELLTLTYEPSVKADFQRALELGAARERIVCTTLVGPHRDDIALNLQTRSAAQFASEGQKRSIAIALKMAQAERLMESTGVPPILLLDDVMGELDRQRRDGLLPLLMRNGERRGQVFMTCTEEKWSLELGRDLTRWQVDAGALKRVP